MNQLKKNCDFSMIPSFDDNNEIKMQQDVPYFFRKRYLVAALAFVGNAILFILRVNLSICMVDMTSKKVATVENVTMIQEAEFAWTASEKGIIFSSLSWGLVTSPFTVVFAKKFGEVNMFSLAIFLTGILTILSPILIESGFYYYVAGRFLEGVTEVIDMVQSLYKWRLHLMLQRDVNSVQGLSVSAAYGVSANWVPPTERARLASYMPLGCSAGLVIGYPLSGYISHLYGWRMVFYITGAMALIWSLVWSSLVRNYPLKDFFITSQEKIYLQSVVETVPEKKDIHLWKLLVTSKAVMAYLNELFVHSWSFSFLMYFLPAFVSDVHNVSIEKISVLSTLPHLCNIFTRVFSGWFQDYLRNRRMMSKTKVHKMYISISQGSAVVLLLLAGIWQNFYACITAFCLFRIFFGFAEVSYWVIPLDLAAQHSSYIMSLKLASVSMGYFLNPLILGFMVENQTYTEWSHYFWFLAIFNLWGLLIFSRFGSGELQSWAIEDENRSSEAENIS